MRIDKAPGLALMAKLLGWLELAVTDLMSGPWRTKVSWGERLRLPANGHPSARLPSWLPATPEPATNHRPIGGRHPCAWSFRAAGESAMPGSPALSGSAPFKFAPANLPVAESLAELLGLSSDHRDVGEFDLSSSLS